MGFWEASHIMCQCEFSQYINGFSYSSRVVLSFNMFMVTSGLMMTLLMIYEEKRGTSERCFLFKNQNESGKKGVVRLRCDPVLNCVHSLYLLDSLTFEY